jgi:threonine aldolase
VAPVETNIVLLEVEHMNANEVAQRAAARGVLIHALGPHALRAVTHSDISEQDTLEAADLLAEILAP